LASLCLSFLISEMKAEKCMSDRVLGV
jgi:hypothetical protein